MRNRSLESIFAYFDEEEIVKLIKQSKVVVDLGSGDGVFVRSLSRLYPEKCIIGVDGFPVIGIERHGNQLHALFASIPLPTSSVDLSISTYAFLYYGFKEKPDNHFNELREISRILKPEGCALILCKVIYTNDGCDLRYTFLLRSIEDDEEYQILISDRFFTDIGLKAEIVSQLGQTLSVLRLTRISELP